MHDRETLIRFHAETCRAARLLMMVKSRSYATNDNPLANFEVQDTLGLADVPTGILCRMGDKYARLIRMAIYGETDHMDSIRDACVDMLNYSILLLFHLTAQEDLPSEPDDDNPPQEISDR